jgi:phage tail sheath protein FI
MDVITHPIPAGQQFGVRIGHNTSTNAVIQGDNYTRMTHFIAATLNQGMGRFVGRLHSADERRRAASTLTHFLSNLEHQGLIGDVNGGSAFSVQIDEKNNPMKRVALGYLQADVKVVYLSIIEKFLINVEAGQSVRVARGSTATP